MKHFYWAIIETGNNNQTQSDWHSIQLSQRLILQTVIAGTFKKKTLPSEADFDCAARRLERDVSLTAARRPRPRSDEYEHHS